MFYVSGKDLKNLKDAFQSGNLALYLGAGVSVDSNLPTWEKLVLFMFFSTISEQHLGGWRPFSNYLFAIAEWHLSNSREPLEITARKLWKYYDPATEDFLNHLYLTLYSGLLDKTGNPLPYIDQHYIRANNATLDAVSKLCEASRQKNKGVQAVISYNYDDLLEIALSDFPCQPIDRQMQVDASRLPIYHVHGFVPLRKDATGTRAEAIVFTEDQYHKVARSPYYWSNLIQLQSISSSVGLMIGLSLSDRNMRRLLDAVKNAPINAANYALLKKSDKEPPDDGVLDDIHAKAKRYLKKFEKGGIKSEEDQLNRAMYARPGIKSSGQDFKSSRMSEKGPRYRHEISGIIEQVKKLDQGQKEYVMSQLGITPIWFDEYSDIPDFIGEFLNS